MSSARRPPRPQQGRGLAPWPSRRRRCGDHARRRLHAPPRGRRGRAGKRDRRVLRPADRAARRPGGSRLPEFLTPRRRPATSTKRTVPGSPSRATSSASRPRPRRRKHTRQRHLRLRAQDEPLQLCRLRQGRPMCPQHRESQPRNQHQRKQRVSGRRQFASLLQLLRPEPSRPRQHRVRATALRSALSCPPSGVGMTDTTRMYSVLLSPQQD